MFLDYPSLQSVVPLELLYSIFSQAHFFSYHTSIYECVLKVWILFKCVFNNIIYIYISYEFDMLRTTRCATRVRLRKCTVTSSRALFAQHRPWVARTRPWSGRIAVAIRLESGLIVAASIAAAIGPKSDSGQIAVRFWPRYRRIPVTIRSDSGSIAAAMSQAQSGPISIGI